MNIAVTPTRIVLRVSTISSQLLCPQLMNLSIHGFEPGRTLPMILGTCAHSVREYMARNSRKIITSLNAGDDPIETIRGFREKAVQFAVDRMRPSVNDETLKQIETAVTNDAYKDTEIDVIALKDFEEAWLYYQHPKTLLMEDELRCEVDVTLEKDTPREVTLKAEILGHPDLVFQQGDAVHLIDYKNGHVAPMRDWIYGHERAQLNLYAWLLESIGINVDFAAIYYLQARGTPFALRYIKPQTSLAQDYISFAVQCYFDKIETQRKIIWFCKSCYNSEPCIAKDKGYDWPALVKTFR